MKRDALGRIGRFSRVGRRMCCAGVAIDGLVFSLVFIAVGLVAIFVAAKAVGDDIVWSSHAASTTGEVVSNTVTMARSRRSSGPRRMYQAHIRFEVKGQPFEFDDNIAGTTPRFEVGDRVGVQYISEDPNQARVDSLPNHWMLPGIFGTLGSIFVWTGYCFARKSIAA